MTREMREALLAWFVAVFVAGFAAGAWAFRLTGPR
jgi:hypothetical protein